MIDVREARADDYDVYQRLFPELGVNEGATSRERFTTDLATRMFVAIDAEQVVGYLLFDLMDGVGYVRNVVSDPDRRRAGIGIALMEAARERFVRAGATTWCLNVKAENRAAIALYERCGMGLHYRTTVLRLPRSVSLPPVDPSLSLVPVPPETDAVVEPAFALLPGQLASARNKAGRMVLQLARGDDVLGVGVFVPSVPGSFPFRLASSEHAAAFLALLREHAHDGAAFVQVGAENDAALAAQVLALGAYVQLELLHMHGSLA
ncbi:MAG: GNAT family N-acetyltransferase [Kofleriaceae bacterium]